MVWLALACGNNGGVGDGVYDDSIAPGGSTASAGRANGRAGTTGSSAGAIGQSGSGGRGGASGAGGTAAAGGKNNGGSAGTEVGSASGSSVAGSSSGGAGGASGGSGGLGGGGAGPAGGAGPLTCGNGIIDTGETCDSGTLNGDANAGTGGTSSGGTGGGGGRTAGGTEETGGAPAMPATYGQLCSNTCYKVGTQACLDCENAGDCFESVNNCLGVLEPFTAAQQSSCYSVMRCIQESNCFDGTGTLGKCYCGDLTLQACGSAPFSGAGSPNGACVAQIKAGFPTLSSNSAVLGGLVATDFPSGAAMKRLSCQKGANTSACLAACGFTSGAPAFP